MKKRFSAVTLIAVLLLSACAQQVTALLPVPATPTQLPLPATATPAAAVAVADFRPEKVDWKTCPTSITEQDGFQCAVIDVPLDYADPAGAQIGIQIVRLPAVVDGMTPLLGPLLVNPGGPGASGIDWAVRDGGFADLVNEVGLSGFDLISFDPRGVGLSGGLYCQSDADIDKYRYPDSTPDDDAEKAFVEEARDAFATACKAKYGESLQHYSTTNTARDMDSIRQAIGADQISYIGFSYGTYLGGVYSNMYPANVRAMVLDGAFQPEGDTLEQTYTTQLSGFEKAMDNWVAWCQVPTNSCAFVAPDVSARWDALWQQYDDNPVTADDGRVANQRTIEDATHNALYGESWWPELGLALAEAEQGDTERLWYIVDTFDERDEDGHYSSSESAFPLIMCASGIVYDAVPDAEALLAKMRAISPRFTRDANAADLAAEDDCYTLLTPPPVSPISNANDVPMVVIGGFNDPATPMRWAEKMTSDLGPNARLVTYSGEGHTALTSATCIDEIASALLVDLTLPDNSTACAPDPDVARPAWWASLPSAPEGATTFDAQTANAYLGLENRNAYSTAYTQTGTTADIVSDLNTAFVAAGYAAEEAFDTFYSAQRAAYTKGKQRVVVIAVGSDVITSDDWSYLAGDVATNEGMVFYIIFAPQE